MLRLRKANLGEIDIKDNHISGPGEFL